jgi:hypothetical protein
MTNEMLEHVSDKTVIWYRCSCGHVWAVEVKEFEITPPKSS